MSNSTLYEQDFHAWANEQAGLLRAGRLAEADIAHIAEAYRIARIEAENETAITDDTFPPACPWSFEQMMAEDFWPDAMS